MENQIGMKAPWPAGKTAVDPIDFGQGAHAMKDLTSGTTMVAMGLDVHQHVVQVCVLDGAGRVLSNRRVPNDVEAIVRQGRAEAQVTRVALECGSGTAALADALIQRTGWDVHLCHPGYVRRMRQNPDKTDLSDARLLGDLARVGYLPRVWLAPAAIRDLRTLVRYRQQVVDRQRNTKLRIRALLREHRIPAVPKSLWSRRGLAWLRNLTVLPPLAQWVLESHLSDLAKDTALQVRVTAGLQAVAQEDRLITTLQQQPGIGLVTACVLRAEVGYFRRFRTGKQLSHFCGVSPCNASSGARQADAGLVRGCSRYLRDAVIEAAHRLARYDARWSGMKQQMRARGKPGSVIAAAIANRWMRGLFHTMRTIELAA
jgi:transposase